MRIAKTYPCPNCGRDYYKVALTPLCPRCRAEGREEERRMERKKHLAVRRPGLEADLPACDPNEGSGLARTTDPGDVTCLRCKKTHHWTDRRLGEPPA